MRRQLSLNVAENASDFEEIGAATTTTSCSENELDSAAVGGVTTRSGTGTADDEDSQPTPQQVEQQQQVGKIGKKLETISLRFAENAVDFGTKRTNKSGPKSRNNLSKGNHAWTLPFRQICRQRLYQHEL